MQSTGVAIVLLGSKTSLPDLNTLVHVGRGQDHICTRAR